MWIALLLACRPGPTFEPPAAEPWHWVGADGRVVIHRGMNLNATAKRAPDHRHGLTDEDLARLPDYGITLVRYLVFWQGLEPEEGAFDEAYLERIRADVAAFEALGLEVVLDLHQDVYGEGFGHVGFPRWTCAEDVYAQFEPSSGDWFLDYTHPAVVECFDRFWASEPLQEAYADAAARLVGHLGEHDGVVGLDVVNEPFWGSTPQDAFESEVLPAFYRRVVEAVRAEDPDLRLFLAPSVGTNLTAEPALDLSGLDDPHLGVSPHFYPSYAELGTGWDGDLTDEAAALDRLAAHARDQGLPLLLGEFGIFSEEGNEDAYVAGVLERMSTHGASAAWWAYDRSTAVLEDDGDPGWLLLAFDGPYPHRVPGRLDEVDGGYLRFTHAGPGVVEWRVPAESACRVDVLSGPVGTVRRDGAVLEVELFARGGSEITVTCE